MCQYKREDIERYFCNEMTESEEVAFQKHLLHCEDCRRELGKYRRLSAAIAEPEGVGEVRVVPFVVRHRKWVAAASLLLLVGLGITMAFLSRGTEGGSGEIVVPGGAGVVAQGDTLQVEAGDTISEIIAPAKEQQQKNFTQKPAKPRRNTVAEEDDGVIMPSFDEPKHYAKKDTFAKSKKNSVSDD